MRVCTALDQPNITKPAEHPRAMAHKCEFILNIGMFFDGTGNNWYEDAAGQGHSNVARLWRAYKDRPMEGFFAHYAPGVGTPFKDIGEEGQSKLGLTLGWGGEARIVWGLLQVLNSMHRFLKSDESMFSPKEIETLCSNTTVPSSFADSSPASLTDAQTILDGLGLRTGLVDNWSTRHAVMSECAGKLTMLHNNPKTSIQLTGINLDVFGFSRGAAQARVFCNWLQQGLLVNGKMFGVPAHIRMLGIFDTVASVGPGSSGHGDWSSSHNLRIPPESVVKNCVHFVALHELRKNFPLESVRVNGVLPSHCNEHVYPGSHSDVGGGYQPGEQGKAMAVKQETTLVKADHFKLSQLTLNDMFAAALKTVPRYTEDSPWLEFQDEKSRDYQAASDLDLPRQFLLPKYTQQAVAKYFAEVDADPNLPLVPLIQAHSLAYLAWRYRVTLRNGFNELDSVKRANDFDAARVLFYKKGQALLEEQIRLMRRWSPENTMGYHPKAGEIYEAIQRIRSTDAKEHFFDDWVHDSFAGFLQSLGRAHVVVENECYLRHRGIYMGEDDRVATLYFDPNELSEFLPKKTRYA